MDTKTFLSRVSAALDNIVVSLRKPDPTGKAKDGHIFWNRGSFHDLDDAVAAIQMWDRDPDWSVFFSVGRMADNVEVDAKGKTSYKRTKAHATWFKSICFDMDIGTKHKYKTQREGHTALLDAIGKIGLPEPMVVSSGGGIHYYWPLTRPLKRDDWEKASVALRLALVEHEVEIDTSKIHDASMVLRPAGTSNKKEAVWRPVKVLQDCPDYAPEDIAKALKPWVGKVSVPSKAKALKPGSIAAAILRNANLNIDVLASKCPQIQALLASGGEFDAAGNIVSEQTWRGSLGIAVHTPDPETAMIRLCSKHPDFDHDANMKKMAAWVSAPPTCAYFEQHCPGGCTTCQYKGVVSPASINEEQPTPAVTITPVNIGQALPIPQEAFQLPRDYYVAGGNICTDIEKETKEKDSEGKTIITKVKAKTVVCPYEIHVTAMYSDLAHTESTATILVNYPLEGWKQHDLPMSIVGQGGNIFSAYLINKQIIIPNDGQVISTRSFLMRYLEEVQSKIPSGVDFKCFGWQEDGSFLCGDTVVGAPSGNTLRRLKGPAAQYAHIVRKQGDRELWAEATKFVDLPNAEFLGVSLLTACMGALNDVSGAGTSLVCFYSSDTGTGKTIALALGNSAFMDPHKRYMLNPEDTDNSIFMTLGTLGALSGSMDELTMMKDDDRAAKLAYQVSQGREKNRVSRDLDLHLPATWTAPLRISSNKSLYEMYDAYMNQNAPLKVRTLQFTTDNKEFVIAHGMDLFNIIRENYGFALPEIADEVIKQGGYQKAWNDGVVAFDKHFKFTFQSEERYFRCLCITCYIVGEIGAKLGLFRFSIERVIHCMLNRVVELRHTAVISRRDAFDILGQYMQEYNHQLIVSKELQGSNDAKPQYPLPDSACLRLDILHDPKGNPVVGAKLSVNKMTFKHWLKRTNDSVDRVMGELHTMGALLNDNERVTMYRGCPLVNPGQAYCFTVDLTHPRMASALMGNKPVPVTLPAVAVLQP